jgi:hypothetical protein
MSPFRHVARPLRYEKAGGPSIGDIRSRLIRLIPRTHERALTALLSHRLTGSEADVKAEWRSIVEGRHPLWRGVSQRDMMAQFDLRLLRILDGGRPKGAHSILPGPF